MKVYQGIENKLRAAERKIKRVRIKSLTLMLREKWILLKHSIIYVDPFPVRPLTNILILVKVSLWESL